jgi:hypothetical protein
MNPSRSKCIDYVRVLRICSLPKNTSAGNEPSTQEPMGILHIQTITNPHSKNFWKLSGMETMALKSQRELLESLQVTRAMRTVQRPSRKRQ